MRPKPKKRGKNNTSFRNKRFEMRCTSAFKEALRLESEFRNMSEADLLHYALSDFILKKSLSWHHYPANLQQSIKQHLLINHFVTK